MTVTVNAYPSNLQWVGAAKEAVPGVAEAAPTFWIPVDGSSLKYKANQSVLTDQAYRGMMSADFQQVQGMRFDTLAYKSYIYMDSVYQHILALLGKPDTVTGSAAPYTHKTSVENGVDNPEAQPPAFTLFYFDGAKCRQIPGCICSDVKIDVKVDQLVTLDVSWTGLDAVVMGSAPTNTPSTNAPIPSWNTVIKVAGTAVSQYSEVSLDYKRDVADVPTINASQSPLEIFGGGVSMTGTLTAVYQGASADPDLAAYLANTQHALTVVLAPIGDAVHSLTLQHSVVAYDSADPAGSNKWMEIQSTIKALANAADALDSEESCAQAVMVSAAATY